MIRDLSKIGLLLFLLITALYSCKKDQANYDLHYDYFGMKDGRYIDYDVTEIHHDATSSIPHDTTRYQLRTLIGDTIIDNEGRIARKFIRFKRNNASESWVQTDVWSTIIADRRAELVEENQRIVKLVFEPTESKEWNINAFNLLPELAAYYRNIHEKQSINGVSFDSTLVVEQEDFFSLIDYRRKYEVYANNVGLIQKYYKNLVINGFDTLNVKSGDELFYNCIGFGFQ
ncbi:MAG: hypothetical protein ACK5FX_05825 [Flavobacteriia bacterium]